MKTKTLTMIVKVTVPERSTAPQIYAILRRVLKGWSVTIRPAEPTLRRARMAREAGWE